MVGYVLGDFSKEELALLPELIARAADTCDCWLREGLTKAMNKFNRR